MSNPSNFVSSKFLPKHGTDSHRSQILFIPHLLLTLRTHPIYMVQELQINWIQVLFLLIPIKALQCIVWRWDWRVKSEVTMSFSFMLILNDSKRLKQYFSHHVVYESYQGSSKGIISLSPCKHNPIICGFWVPSIAKSTISPLGITPFA